MPQLRDLELADPQAPGLLRALAASAARMGGQLAARSFGKPLRVELKSDGSEVTDIDRAVERTVIAHLRAARPQDAFIGEESIASDRSGGAPAPREDQIVWVIDPIDGTRNFVRRTPLFCCSVAALREGRPIAAAIFDPTGGEEFTASLAGGAYLGGQRISLERADSPLGATGQRVVAIPSARDEHAQAAVHAIIERHVVRNLGCTTMHMTYVAAGRFDAALKTTCRLWDIAAGALIVDEAGGACTRLDGTAIFPIDVSMYSGEKIPCLSGTRMAHAQLIAEIRAAEQTA